VPSLRFGLDGVSTLLVGDAEGRLWELDARTGANVHLVRDSGSCNPVCKYPAFDAVGPTNSPVQPVSSNIAQARLPSAPSGALSSFGNELVAIFGTAGADWVPNAVGGKVHVVLLGDRYKKPVFSGGKHLDGTPWTRDDARDSARDWGIYQEPDGLPIALTAPERVYGNITISGRVAFVPVAGGVIGQPESIQKNISGRTLMIDLGNLAANANAASLALADHNLANFGGVTVLHVASGSGSRDLVIGAEVSKLTKYVETNAGTSGKATADSKLSPNQSLPYRLLNAVRRFVSQQ
jgi:type IV pilus assembly protein PilY1